MRILVIGSGAREHALVEWLSRSHRKPEIYCAPGNAGIAGLAKCEDIAVGDLPGLLKFAQSKAIDFTIVGPELPLTLGIVDLFQLNKLKIFGPTKMASQLEASKAFTKGFCRRHNIPTAPYVVSDSFAAVSQMFGVQKYPLVIKADGLAAGKGVVIVQNAQEAGRVAHAMLVEKKFGEAGSKIVIEEFMPGEEASFIVMANGTSYVELPCSQDHKRVFDQDQGPNTGGMGAYAPAKIITDEVRKKVRKQIIEPTLNGMVKEGIPFHGFLYAGLMIDAQGEPRVVEFNCRLGDPEAEVLLPLIESDAVDVFLRSLDGKLADFPPQLKAGACAAVVLASGGYPEKFEKGFPIQGLNEKHEDGVKIFHAGTEMKDGKLVTAGGRVLVVSATDSDLRSAIDKAYRHANKITWSGRHMRKDIGHKGL